MNLTIGSSAILPEFNQGSLANNNKNGRRRYPVYGSQELFSKNTKSKDIFGSLLQEAFLTSKETKNNQPNLRLLNSQNKQRFLSEEANSKDKATFFDNQWQKKTSELLHDYWA